jgi:hypothetical protein
MTDVARAAGRSRREFMKDIAACGTAAITAARLGDVVGAQTSEWKHKIGLELYTVRDRVVQAASARSWGDSLAAARVSYQNLTRILS